MPRRGARPVPAWVSQAAREGGWGGIVAFRGGVSSGPEEPRGSGMHPVDPRPESVARRTEAPRLLLPADVPPDDTLPAAGGLQRRGAAVVSAPSEAREAADPSGQEEQAAPDDAEASLRDMRQRLAGAVRAIAVRPGPEAEALVRDFRNSRRVAAPLRLSAADVLDGGITAARVSGANEEPGYPTSGPGASAG